MSVVSELDVENALCDLFAALGWTVTTGAALAPERANQREVFLLPRLRAALATLNPDAPEEVRDDALRELTRDRTSMELVNANREVHTLLVDGFKGAHTAPDGTVSQHSLRYLDVDTAAKNDFVLARQLTVTGAAGDFRPDLVGFVNGIPLVVGELKDAAVGLDTALTKNLTPYRTEIPQLFVPNAMVLLSNFTDTRVGTFTGTALEHFAPYTRLTEDDPRSTDAATTLRAVFTPGHLLDYVESFVLYEQGASGLRKLLAQNHQRLGVNAAVARIAQYGALVDAGVSAKALEAPRKLGVYWHTQGSGKSYSMAFLVRKVLRKVAGDWSFVVVTDREDLDAQIHANFVRTGVTPNKKGLRAKSAKELKKLLGGNERVVFTLIQKFRPEEGATAMAVLSKSPRVLVLADEAHRSQYATFSTAMRAALPGAAFMAFTGTPLLDADTTTREKFGDYVSRYPFFQAIEDGATVPLFYEAAVADLQLSQTDLDAAMDRATKEESLSDDDRKAIEDHFSREYILLTRSKRLEQVAQHLVDHLLGFAPTQKAMAVCLDRPTTLRLARHVEAVLAKRRTELQGRIEALEPYETSRRAMMERALGELDALEWAVVVSRTQGDVDALARQMRHHAKGVVAYVKAQAELLQKMSPGVSESLPAAVQSAVEEAKDEEAKTARDDAQDPADLEARAWVAKALANDPDQLATRFKDPADPLRLVFVCSMWITGFDAPPCGVVYLDRPMANHTLMQTIARANRVFPGKPFGLVMDFVGVLRNLEKAFNAYEKEHAGDGVTDRPVVDKQEEIQRLATAIADAKSLCEGLGVSLPELAGSDRTKRLAAVKEAVELFAGDAPKRRVFRGLAGFIDRRFRALGDDPRVTTHANDRALLVKLSAALGELDAPRDLSALLARLDDVLDAAMEADLDRPLVQTARLDLGAVDAVALADAREALARVRAAQAQGAEEGAEPVPKAKVAAVASMVERWAREAAQSNPTLVGLQQSVEQALADYAEGARDFGALVAALVGASDRLAAESARAESEGLAPEELAHLDVLCEALGEGAGDPATRDGVKHALRALRDLRGEVGRDWRDTDQGRSAVRVRVLNAFTDALSEKPGAKALEALTDALWKRFYERL
jgi:type I restriction enzyme, R subunit